MFGPGERNGLGQAATGMTTGSWFVAFGAKGCEACETALEALESAEEDGRAECHESLHRNRLHVENARLYWFCMCGGTDSFLFPAIQQDL